MRPVRSRFLLPLCVLAALGLACKAKQPAAPKPPEAVKVAAASKAEPAKPEVAKAEAEAEAEAKAKADAALQLQQEKARGKAFLEKAAHEKGAILTKSGMVYIPTKTGTGPSAAKASSVRLGHVSKLIDGKVFDHASSIELDIEAVIPCWQEGIKMMKVGGSARLVCPPELAFEDRGAQGIFPPGSTMVYELDLRGIIK